MANARVLVVDDSVVFRRTLSVELAADGEFEIVAAANGRLALEKLVRTPVDAVVLDVEMPELDGLATLKELRKTHPRLPVVMFSTLTERGAEATLDALSLGADDYFPKPATSSLEASSAIIREQLLPKLKTLIAADRARAVRPVAAAAPPMAKAIPAALPSNPVTFVAIGSSTGGPNALAEVFAGLSADFPVPIAIVQHMPPMFTKLLADRLGRQSGIHTTEAEHGQILKPGTAVVAPGDYHLEVAADPAGVLRAKLHQAAHENSCRPAVDVLFRSAAQARGAGVLGVVLTGMGQDGMRGAEAIASRGGRVIVQDESTSIVWGMPGAVARAGRADAVLPLPEIAAAIMRRVRSSKPAP